MRLEEKKVTTNLGGVDDGDHTTKADEEQGDEL